MILMLDLRNLNARSLPAGGLTAVSLGQLSLQEADVGSRLKNYADSILTTEASISPESLVPLISVVSSSSAALAQL